MEATELRKSIRSACASTLSIAALLFLVNAHAEPLPSVNKGVRPAISPAKSKAELDRLIALLLQRGADKKIAASVAPLIGLEKSADVKQQDNIIKQDDKAVDVRTCYVVFSDNPDQKIPMCLFVRRTKQTATTSESRYFKVSLLGKLEKAVEIQGKRTTEGHGVRGSAVTSNQDIDSPVIKKEFDSEMAYWLKDWLKKESKTPAKKTSASATKADGKTASL